MNTVTSSLRPVSAALALAALLLMLATPPGASACTGGVAFDWAVAHQRGGIVQGTVESRFVREDFSEDLVITDPKVVRDEPDLTLSVNTVAGLPCDQVADKGETILLIYDVRGVSIPVPLYYVVRGPDALAPSALEKGLAAAMPPTDGLLRRGAEGPLMNGTSIVILAGAATIGFAVGIRRTSSRKSCSPVTAIPSAGSGGAIRRIVQPSTDARRSARAPAGRPGVRV